MKKVGMLLLLSIQKDNIAAVRLLLQPTANPNLNSYNVTCQKAGGRDVPMPLDDANQKGNIQIIRLLKSQGAKTGLACHQ